MESLDSIIEGLEDQIEKGDEAEKKTSVNQNQKEEKDGGIFRFNPFALKNITDLKQKITFSG